MKNQEQLKIELNKTINQTCEKIDWKLLEKLGYKGITKTKREICDYLIAKNWD
jgi:hypothetical protein